MRVLAWIGCIFFVTQLIGFLFLEWMNRAMGGEPWSLFKRMK